MKQILNLQNNLKAHLGLSQLNQIQLAERAGVSVCTINRLLNYALPVSPAIASKLALALSCKPNDLFPFLALGNPQTMLPPAVTLSTMTAPKKV